MRSLYSYVLTHDTGFAPNPFHGYCTLATCKPDIRKAAKQGDWIVGTSGKTLGDDAFRIIYAMQVTEDPMPFNRYDDAPQFQAKKPEEGTWKTERGDNIYHREDGSWRQRPNPFHGEKQKEDDLEGRQVLISDHFVYFGNDTLPLSDQLKELAHANQEGSGHVGHKEIEDQKLIDAFIEWLDSKLADEGLDWGHVGEPHNGELQENWRVSRSEHSCGHDH